MDGISDTLINDDSPNESNFSTIMQTDEKTIEEVEEDSSSNLSDASKNISTRTETDGKTSEEREEDSSSNLSDVSQNFATNSKTKEEVEEDFARNLSDAPKNISTRTETDGKTSEGREDSSSNLSDVSKNFVTNSKTNEEIEEDSSSNLSDASKNVSTGTETDGKTNEKVNDCSDVEIQSSYDAKHVHYDGDDAIYTEPSSGYQYKWNKTDEKWEPRNQVEYGFEDDTHTYKDADGVKFFWDKEKSAWFPKIDDDFMAQYQMSYGFIDNVTKEEKPKIEEKHREIKKVEPPTGIKRKPEEPTWFEQDDQHNTKVYVSNLPLNLTEEEFVELMQKCGLVMRDPISSKMKIKLYKEPNSDVLKGDALCTYIRIESVDLALKLLDGYDFKGKKIKVERAKFQQKGDYDPKLKPKSKKRKDKQKLKRMQEKLFDWRPEKVIGERAKHEKVVIVKNVFESKIFDEDVGLILEFQQDLREEASKCGEVRKVTLYDRHPEGVAQINMKEPEEADAVVLLLNGRWFGKRKLTAEIWDGKTKFKIAETDSEISQRIDNWDKFLEDSEDGKKKEEEEISGNLQK